MQKLYFIQWSLPIRGVGRGERGKNPPPPETGKDYLIHRKNKGENMVKGKNQRKNVGKAGKLEEKKRKFKKIREN